MISNNEDITIWNARKEKVAIEYSGNTDYLKKCGIDPMEKNCLDIFRGGWVLCSKLLPKPEEEVFILTKYGTRTTAFYEDGTVREEDSRFLWSGCEFEHADDECFIPEGWWECRHFNQNDAANNEIDEKVVAWQLLPESADI